MYSSWGWNKRPVFRICQSFCVQAGILCYRAKPLDSQTVSEAVLVLSRVLNSRHHLQQLSEITESPNGSRRAMLAYRFGFHVRSCTCMLVSRGWAIPQHEKSTKPRRCDVG
jgi:hypothetical protein